MGALPRLKIKTEIRYRKGSTCESANCQACTHFMPAFYEYQPVTSCFVTDLVTNRCEIIGLRPGARYRVRPDYTCDRQEMGDEYRDYLDKLSGRACCAGRFTGEIQTNPERLSIPMKRRKPTVYAVWNDLFHEEVPEVFIRRALNNAHYAWLDSVRHSHDGHTFLFLTKRPQRMKEVVSRWGKDYGNYLPGIFGFYFGLTVCNQQEAAAKIPIFLQVPGKKFLSIEPMLGPIDLGFYFQHLRGGNQSLAGQDGWPVLNAVILGGETGPGARPLHPDWVRSVRDQCAAAGVPFFFKAWGGNPNGRPIKDRTPAVLSGYEPNMRNGGRLLDGRVHDDLPWVDKQNA
jgi:protein gp37